MVSELK